jgi:hypothetical protein
VAGVLLLLCSRTMNESGRQVAMPENRFQKVQRPGLVHPFQEAATSAPFSGAVTSRCSSIFFHQNNRSGQRFRPS